DHVLIVGVDAGADVHALQPALDEVGALGLQRRADQLVDQLLAGLVAEVVAVALAGHDALVVLRREDDGVDAVRGAVGVVLDGDLALGVGPGPGQGAALAQAGVVGGLGEGGVGGDLAGDDDEVGGDERFAGDAAGGVGGEAVVQDRVGDLVGHLVGVAHRHGFGREKVSIRAHGIVALGSEG